VESEPGAWEEARDAVAAARDALRAVLAEVDAYLGTLRPVLGREIRQIFDRELTAVAEAVRALERALQALAEGAAGGGKRG